MLLSGEAKGGTTVQMMRQIRSLATEGYHAEQGMAMIMALIALTLGTLLIVPTLSYAATVIKSAAIYERCTLEIYTADAGVGLVE